MTTGVILSLLACGLALLLARENKLRRALQVLCARLLNRLADKTARQPHSRTHTQAHASLRTRIQNQSHSQSKSQPQPQSQQRQTP